MKLAFTLSLLLTGILSSPLAALAGSAEEFHARFLNELGTQVPAIASESQGSLHFGAGPALTKLLGASTLEEALAGGRALDLSKIAEGASGLKAAKLKALGSRELTIVLLPGVFAEFIKNRAFEEVLEKDSAFRDEFRAAVKAAKERGEASAEDAVDLVRFHASANASENPPVALDQLVSVGETRVEGNRVRVVLLGTPFGSLESLGRSEERASLFTRRLEKYLAITGPQDLAFVGYSRGTILGLEMLAEAKRANRPWLKHTKALISLGGVIWGSSLADDAISNEQAPMHRLLKAIERTISELELIPESASLAERGAIFTRNTKRWLALVSVARAETKELNEGKDLLAEARSMIQVDPRSPAFILVSIWKELGLLKFFSGYNANIQRAQYAFGELAASIRELGTDARLAWWKKNTLPKNVTYYALTGVMANPEANAFEKSVFANAAAYGSGSYDDVMLLQNRKDYEKISGLSVNDSQVAIPQAVFLPKLMAKLNRANRGLRTEFLGVVGTHHWGLALREVNKMSGGQQNGFPREALLRALAGQVISDLR
jgi:pimeloyl-ACP methyl ester carboxylesterase